MLKCIPAYNWSLYCMTSFFIGHYKLFMIKKGIPTLRRNFSIISFSDSLSIQAKKYIKIYKSKHFLYLLEGEALIQEKQVESSIFSGLFVYFFPPPWGDHVTSSNIIKGVEIILVIRNLIFKFIIKFSYI